MAYLLAVTQRSSLGVATLMASERFDTNAQQLATLAVFQLVVYAAMQIPVGILLDRYGAKKLLAVGAIIMALGQITVALSTTLGPAVLGRMLVGMGDSFTFISMIRMVNGWYEGSKASRVQQYLSTAGQLGQFISAVPFWFLLEGLGWTPGFAIMAGASGIVTILIIAFTANDANPHDLDAKAVASLKVSLRQLLDNMKNPGIRMAFWTHFVSQPTTTSISLLWAIPYLVTAQGRSHEFAVFTLSAMVGFGLITGPIIGSICSRAPKYRTTLLYSVVFVGILAWLVLLSNPDRSSDLVLVTCFLLISIGGPASMIAFDFSKDIVPKNALGTANGFANVGGFLASFCIMYMTGFIIDTIHAQSGLTERYTVEAFRWAFAAPLLVIVLGLVFFAVERRKYLLSEQNLGNKALKVKV